MRYIILCFILIIQVSILTGCNYYVPKTIKIKENAYTLDKHHFMHIKNKYLIRVCDSYYDLCTGQNSSLILNNTNNIIDIYSENEDSLVVVIKDDISAIGNLLIPDIERQEPIIEIKNGYKRLNYGYSSIYKIKFIMEYKI